MVQDQLVDYISAQVKAGASKETIKSALLGVGWQAADVEDSFKKFEGSAPAVAATGFKPAAVTAQPTVTVAGPTTKAASAFPASTNAMASPAAARPAVQSSPMNSGPGPQVIRMSDLVSASDGPMSTMGVAQKKDAAAPAKMATTMTSMPTGSSSKKGMTMSIIGGVVILVLLGLSGYLYMQNNSLSGQISSLSGQSSSVTSQVASLTSQVNALTASSTALAASTTALMASNQELMTELSFYAVPAGTTATATPISITGVVNVNTAKNYFVVGTYGGKIFIGNSKAAGVGTALQPYVGSSTQLGGTFVPGSDSMTLTSVNGTSL